MVEAIKSGKSVPWSHLERYLEVHQRAISALLDLHKSKLIDVSEIEAKLPKSFMQLHEVITKILEDNKLIQK